MKKPKAKMTAVDLRSLFRAHGLPEPEPEVRFHHLRRWRWDWCWVRQKLALEIQGGTWTNGRHTRGRGYRNDCEKQNAGVLLGWRILNVTTDMVKSGEVLELVREALRDRLAEQFKGAE